MEVRTAGLTIAASGVFTPMGSVPALQEIVVPDTEPETEWILGEAVQKVSPRRRHAVLQGALVSLLRTWAHGRGIVGTERRFRITPPGERPRPLVTDVAYLSNERRAGLSGELLEVPFVPPDIVIEASRRTTARTESQANETRSPQQACTSSQVSTRTVARSTRSTLRAL